MLPDALVVFLTLLLPLFFSNALLWQVFAESPRGISDISRQVACCHSRSKSSGNNSKSPLHGRAGAGSCEHEVARVLFVMSASLSLALLQLLIYEVAGILSSAVRLRTWRCVFAALVAVQVGALPAASFAVLAAESGVLSPEVALALAPAFEALYLWLFWVSGKLFPIMQSGMTSDFLSLEGFVGRLGVIGVTTAALLSGYGAIATPYRLLSVLLQDVNEVDLTAAHDAAAAMTIKLLAVQGDLASSHAQWRHAMVAAGLDSPHTLIEPPQRLSAFSANVLRPSVQAAVTVPISRMSVLVGKIGALVRGIMLRFANDASASAACRASVFASVVVDDEAADCSRSVTMLRSEANLLLVVQADLIDEAAKMEETRARLRWAGTLAGRAANAAGYALSVFGLARVIAATANIVLRRDPSTDPVTAGFHFALAFMHLPNAQVWLQPVSFVFVGGLVLSAIRGFFVNFDSIFRAAVGVQASQRRQVRGGGGNGAFCGRRRSSIALLLLAQITGTYAVATVLTMRMSLPELSRHRLTTSVGADIDFVFYHRWFDVFFVLASCSSIVAFMAMHSLRQSQVRSGSGGNVSVDRGLTAMTSAVVGTALSVSAAHDGCSMAQASLPSACRRDEGSTAKRGDRVFTPLRAIPSCAVASHLDIGSSLSQMASPSSRCCAATLTPHMHSVAATDSARMQLFARGAATAASRTHYKVP